MKNQTHIAVWLYGSRARGDYDSISDTDVLVVCEPLVTDETICALTTTLQDSCSISRYSWEEIKSMSRFGSLFLHHIRGEGRPLFESASAQGRLAQLLSNMHDYELAERDLKGFRTALMDVSESMTDPGSVSYELSVVGTVIRHASILGCWLAGNPKFSRTEPVRLFVGEAGLPEEYAMEFPSLYQFRLYTYFRAERPTVPSVEYLRLWLNRAWIILSKLEERVIEQNRTVPVADS